MEVRLHFQCCGCWRWVLAELWLQGEGQNSSSWGDIGHHGDDDEGFHDFACCVMWRWEANACTKCKTDHVRVSL